MRTSGGGWCDVGGGDIVMVQNEACVGRLSPGRKPAQGRAEFQGHVILEVLLCEAYAFGI